MQYERIKQEIYQHNAIKLNETRNDNENDDSTRKNMIHIICSWIGEEEWKIVF